jgi:hypothetical protein
MTEEKIAELDKQDWPRQTFTPSPGQVTAATALIIAGFTVTATIARFGRERKPAQQDENAKKVQK